ncbi:B12-binding domain-containing radical SAM protein [Patescibacteria group bacterium]|nr:MAG: B12-binding domain-containing radical SAM protein [Patescibacteria group bacterium]
MKVVLINPGLSIDSDDASGQETRFFPEGLAVIAAALLRAGHAVQTIDLCAEQTVTPAICQEAEVFGLTGMINQFAGLEVIIPHLRKLNPRARILLGGPLVTCAPELISQLLDFDVAVIGEGERVVAKLLEDTTAESGKPRLVSDMAYLSEKEFLRPAFELFDLPWYVSGLHRPHLQAVGMSGKMINNLMVSRGCPRSRNCAFCGQFFGHAIRCKPLALVNQELGAWTNVGTSAVRFQDDNLTLLPLERQEQLYDLVSRFNLTWAAHSRVDAVNPQLLQRMQQAGCKALYFGLESFSDQALQFAGKGISVAKIQNAIALTQAAGIRPAAFFLLGLPGETRESLHTAIQFVRNSRILVSPYILCPIPGTPLFELARPQIPSMRDFLRSCAHWENRQLTEGKLRINLTDLPDELLLETYRELKELGRH